MSIFFITLHNNTGELYEKIYIKYTSYYIICNLYK